MALALATLSLVRGRLLASLTSVLRPLRNWDQLIGDAVGVVPARKRHGVGAAQVITALGRPAFLFEVTDTDIVREFSELGG